MRSVRHSARTVNVLRPTLPFVCFALPLLLLCAGSGSAVAQDKLFPTDLPGHDWVQFPAAGFSQPACGVIYRLRDRVSSGMPLGAIDTGCINLETSGLFGYCTIFNTYMPRRGPLNLPFLGISVGGRTWVLCDPTKTKRCGSTGDRGAVETDPMELSLEGVRTVREIHYWGHYPVADLEYETDAPVSVGLRAWASFLPGGSTDNPNNNMLSIPDSLIPGAVFEVHLRNPSGSDQEGTVAFSFPGPTPGEAGAEIFRRERVEKDFDGVVVGAPQASYALGVIGEERLRAGGELGADGAAWARIGEHLPATADDRPGASAAVDFVLRPGQMKVVRFVLAWYSPQWKAGGSPTSNDGNTFTHMYAKYYPSALYAAKTLAREHQSLLHHILAWQGVIYSETPNPFYKRNELPVWLRDSLVNVFHVITEDGLWAQAGPPLPDWVRPEDGLFVWIEGASGCQQMECLPGSSFGSIPLALVNFFPRLALSALRGWKGCQDAEGALPCIFGRMAGQTPPIDFAQPTGSCRVTLNPSCYVDMVDQYWVCIGYVDRTEAFLREFYPSVKKATLSMADLNEEHGMSAHMAGIRLATLRIAERMAMAAGDDEFARQCREWIEAGQNTLETKMWNGTHYLSFWDPASGEKSDNVFAYQLEGEWMAKFHGLAGVYRPDRFRIALETIKKLNVSPTPYGALSYVHPDGGALGPHEWPMGGAHQPYDICLPEVFVLAMTYMYQDMNQKTVGLTLDRYYADPNGIGLELARRCIHNIVIEQGMTWDLPTIIRGDTGEGRFGSDSGQNLIVWALPALVSGWTNYLNANMMGGVGSSVWQAASRPRPHR